MQMRCTNTQGSILGTLPATPGAQGLHEVLLRRLLAPNDLNWSTGSAGDGQMRVWRIGAQGTLLCTLPAAQGRMECVNCICKDRAQTKVFVGDTGGHVRIWDISKGIDASSEAASAASFKQVGSAFPPRPLGCGLAPGSVGCNPASSFGLG